MDITSYLLGKQSGGGGVIGEEINITPSTSQQVITPSAGKNAITKATVSAVDNTIDNNIQAGNIKKDVNILGVTGTYEGTKYSPYQIRFINAQVDEPHFISDLQSIDLKNVTSLAGCFKEIYSTTSNFSLDLSQINWDTSKVTTFGSTFYKTGEKIISLNISGFNFSKVNTYSGMFGGNGTCKLQQIIFPSETQYVLDTSTTGTMSTMFQLCKELQSVNLDFLNHSQHSKGSNISSFLSMFESCEKIQTIKMKNINIAQRTGSRTTQTMFKNCYLLERIDLDSFDFSISGIGASSMFQDCGRDLPEGTYTKVYVKDATAQSFILNTTSLPAGWSTSNVIIAGSADDHRTD